MIDERPDDSGLLLFCAVRNSPDIEIPAHLVLIRHGELAIVARNVAEVASLASPEQAELIEFQQVVRDLFTHRTVVPFRWGSVARSREDLLEMLRSDSALWLDQLNQFDGLVEMGLRLWVPAPAPPEQPSERPRTGADYLRARQAAYQAEAPFDARHPLIAPILESVADRYERIDISSSAKSTELFGSHTVSVAFLITRGTHEAFFEALRESPGFDAIERSEVSGPWPPYSFTGNR